MQKMNQTKGRAFEQKEASHFPKKVDHRRRQKISKSQVYKCLFHVPFLSILVMSSCDDDIFDKGISFTAKHET